ncbi:Metallo-dependent phosphatase-like protein [Xylariaceae sp. FL0594]|nr:Metallo-dependent phosphatase-like protein [Xylariaceae sp. FL0594]
MDETGDRTSDTQLRETRRTRFVCISDTHNCTVKLPKGDVLIHCGDLTNQGSFKELSKQVAWLEQADFECKIVVAGNHDLTLDTEFYEMYGSYRHNSVPQSAMDCQDLLTQAKTLTYLQHESRTFQLISPTGPRTTFSVFGSPWSPAWGDGWAFQYPRWSDSNEWMTGNDTQAAKALWGDIPLDSDIVITHGPARTHLDESRSHETAGCEVLRQQLWRVRPLLSLCGHIHEARGAERVRWDLESKNTGYAELGRTNWEDPTDPDSDKIALINLTAKGGAPLDNDGSRCFSVPDSNSRAGSRQGAGTGATGQGISNEKDQGRGERSVAKSGIGTLGLRGDPHSVRADQEALAGRLGRRETCFVNCAIQHSSYPHSRGPHRRLNKPIVVDLDLPLWEGYDPPQLSSAQASSSGDGDDSKFQTQANITSHQASDPHGWEE